MNNTPTRIAAGDTVTITAQGCTFTGTVQTAHNYGSATQPNWYIQFREANGTPHYWKQESDGGRLIHHQMRASLSAAGCWL